MSANFEQTLADDAAALLSVDGEFAELVEVRPRGKHTWREVYAVVDRNPPEFIGADGSVKRIAALFQFRNHATAGILVTEVRENCEVRYYRKKGDTSTREDALLKLSNEPNAVDAGCIRCEV
jgi:hypothetical protein